MRKREHEAVNRFCLRLLHLKDFSFIFSWRNNTSISVDINLEGILQIANIWQVNYL